MLAVNKDLPRTAPSNKAPRGTKKVVNAIVYAAYATVALNVLDVAVDTATSIYRWVKPTAAPAEEEVIFSPPPEPMVKEEEALIDEEEKKAPLPAMTTLEYLLWKLQMHINMHLDTTQQEYFYGLVTFLKYFFMPMYTIISSLLGIASIFIHCPEGIKSMFLSIMDYVLLQALYVFEERALIQTAVYRGALILSTIAQFIINGYDQLSDIYHHHCQWIHHRLSSGR